MVPTTWFKVDDGLHSHRKVLSMPRRERTAALGLWVLAGSWCADNLTDGHVPNYMVEELGGTGRQAASLCKSGLWFQVDDGYRFHEWNQPGRQPTRAEVEEARESERKRKAEWRAKQTMSHRDNNVSPNGTPNGTHPSVPPSVRTPRPDPSRPSLGLSSQSSPVSETPGQIHRLDLGKIARELHQPATWAARVSRDVLARTGHVSNPTTYVLAAIRSEPQRYQPTNGPPPVNRICDHGRDKLTCPDCEAST